MRHHRNPGASAAAVAALLATLYGCGGETMADRHALAGDVTSCARSQLVEPPACMTPPDIICSRPIEECAAVGCQIAGSGLVLYPDRSWSDPATGATGDWSLSRVDGLGIIDRGGDVLRVEDDGTAVPGC